jgi:archaellum component FlaG (FlaF/FlaG flagellin family)
MMREASAEREALTQSIADSEAKLANLTSDNTQAENHAAEIRRRLEIMSSGQSLPTLNTRIRSIYPTWGFVTLADGNSSGVVANSTLKVVRDGSTIAKLLVTSVERGSASASIIPDSVVPDTTLMVGDQVLPASKDEK